MMKRLLAASISAILILCLFAACGGAASPPAASSAHSRAAAPPAAAEYYPEAEAPSAWDSGYEDGSYKYGSSGNESAIPLPILTPSAAGGKKMVYTVGLSLQTTDFRAGMRKLLDTVSEMGGYVESANVNGRDLRHPETERSAVYRFRVPSERLAEFLVIAEDNYNLLALNQEAQDSTAKYNQSDTRLTDLIEQEKRLLADLEKTEETSERLALERRLAEVQASISGLNASQTAIGDAVLYSTVHVQLYEVILPPDNSEPEYLFGERLIITGTNSINGFVAFCQGVLLVIIAIAPAVFILLIIAAIALPIVRLVKKRSQKKSAETENAKAGTDKTED